MATGTTHFSPEQLRMIKELEEREHAIHVLIRHMQVDMPSRLYYIDKVVLRMIEAPRTNLSSATLSGFARLKEETFTELDNAKSSGNLDITLSDIARIKANTQRAVNPKSLKDALQAIKDIQGRTQGLYNRAYIPLHNLNKMFVDTLRNFRKKGTLTKALAQVLDYEESSQIPPISLEGLPGFAHTPRQNYFNSTQDYFKSKSQMPVAKSQMPAAIPGAMTNKELKEGQQLLDQLFPAIPGAMTNKELKEGQQLLDQLFPSNGKGGARRRTHKRKQQRRRKATIRR